MRIHQTVALPRVVRIAAALAALLVPALALAAPDFDAPYREYSAGREAVALATGDFDEDGLPDVVVSVDAPSADLVFMRQNPDHSFSNAGSWAVSDFLSELAAGDFDGDGHLDLAGLGFNGDLQVHFGNGAGGSTGFVSRPVPFGSIAIERADLNGAADGDDLVVSSYYASQLQTYVGGSGAITPHELYATLVAPAAIGIGDLDGDGFDDIVLAHEFIEVSSVLYTDGAGGIASALSLSYSPYYGSGAAVRDVDGDGRNDVLIGAADGTGMAVYLNVAPLAFSPPSYYGGAAGSANFNVRCGDLDGDGDADVVLGGMSSYVLLNSGTGTFTSGWTALPPGVHSTGEMILRDLDLDGHPDLVTCGSYGATLQVSRGNGDGTFGANLVTDADYSEKALLADVDGDGDRDLVALNGNFSVVQVLARAGAAFGAPAPTVLPGMPSGLASADFDGDGHLDFVTALPSLGQVQVLDGDGAGNLALGANVTTGEFPTGVATGDVDGDGLPDIAVLCINAGESAAVPTAATTPTTPAMPAFLEGFFIILNTGSGFASPVFVAMPGACASDLALGDVSGDGRADVIVAAACADEAQVFRSLGAGAFAAPSGLSTMSGTSTVEVHDLDADGLLDVVAATSSGWVHTFHNLGGGAFANAVDVEATYGATDLAVADFDADGRPDVAVLAFPGVVTLHAGQPGGTIGARQGYGTFTAPSGLLVEDFDTDGDPDLLVTGTAAPLLQFLRNRGGGGGSSAVGDEPVFAAGLLDLGHPSPNPAGAGGTRLLFNLGAARHVTADVFDVRGRLVRRLLGGRDLESGSHVLSWDLAGDDGARVASGVYFARVRAGAEVATRKVFVTR